MSGNMNIWEEALRISQRSSSYFLGPKTENMQYFNQYFNDIVIKDIVQGRQDFHPNDQPFISEETQASEPFQEAMNRLGSILTLLSGYIGQHCTPYYSPRYMAHMIMEPSLSATLGYMMGVFYNQNNFTPDASPITTVLELHFTQDLCKMLGYQRRWDPAMAIPYYPIDNDLPVGWGHITSGGTVANLESLWAARNLKYYTLSLKNAMTQEPNPPLAFIYDRFRIELCTGVTKLFKDCTTWELLNIRSSVILGIPDALNREFGISTTYLDSTMRNYIIQTVGKDVIERQYNMLPPQVLISFTNHFSWPKSAAILGIGSHNLVEVDVEIDGRVDLVVLEGHLQRCLTEMRAVYVVQGIFGSTEMGAVDSIGKILELRTKYEALGLSFLVNADGAWGGYFTSIIAPSPHTPALIPNFAASALNDHTRHEMHNLKHVDAITIDPHKSGYCPYPAGAICYRDERMRFLLTWEAPYVGTQGSVETMGAYSVEASRPGAATVGAWLSAATIGLHERGYGALLSQTVYTAARMWCHWATMENQDWYSTALNLFPVEKSPDCTPEDIESQKEFIRTRILDVPNEVLFQDPEALALLKHLGSDLMINAWAVNFKVNGVANTNALEANYLNHKLYLACTVDSPDVNVNSVDVYVMGSALPPARYGKCVRKFKERIGLLIEDDYSLNCLVNTSMSPFPTEGNFIGTMARDFEKKATEIVRELQWRNTPGPETHSFVLQGKANIGSRLYFTYIPNFSTIRTRRQLIFSGDVPYQMMEKYYELQTASPSSVFTVHSAQAIDLNTIVLLKKFVVYLQEGVPSELGAYRKEAAPSGTYGPYLIENIIIISDRLLEPPYLDPDYPDLMPFYIYGLLGQSIQLDHVLVKSPNICLSSSDVELELRSGPITSVDLARSLEVGAVAVFEDLHERAIQPFNEDHVPQFFVAQQWYNVKIYEGFNPKGKIIPLNPIAVGRIKLGTSVYVDYDYVNRNLSESLNFDHLRDWSPMSPIEPKFGHFLGKRLTTPFDHYHQEIQLRHKWEDDMIKHGILDPIAYDK